MYNKRPVGYIALLRNQFKSISTFAQSYEYIITLIMREKTPNHFLFDDWKVFICKILCPLHPRMLCAIKFGWNGQMDLEKKIFVTYFRQLVIISHWKRTRLFIWINLNPLCLRMLCAKFGGNWPNGSGEEGGKKVYRRTDWIDRRTTGVQKSSGELTQTKTTIFKRGR